MNNSTEFGTQPGIAEEAAPSSPWPPPRVRFGAGALCFNPVSYTHLLPYAMRVYIRSRDDANHVACRKFDFYDRAVVARKAILCQNRSRCFVHVHDPTNHSPGRRQR